MTREEQGVENRLIGRWGEGIAAADLRRKGWLVLAAGYHTRFGEIDLIASKGDILSFVEVKVRKDDVHGSGAEAVDARKQKRIRTTAAQFLARNPMALQPRFDVAEIHAPEGYNTKHPTIRWIENAF